MSTPPSSEQTPLLLDPESSTRPRQHDIEATTTDRNFRRSNARRRDSDYTDPVPPNSAFVAWFFTFILCAIGLVVLIPYYLYIAAVSSHLMQVALYTAEPYLFLVFASIFAVLVILIVGCLALMRPETTWRKLLFVFGGYYVLALGLLVFGGCSIYERRCGLGRQRDGD